METRFQLFWHNLFKSAFEDSVKLMSFLCMSVNTATFTPRNCVQVSSKSQAADVMHKQSICVSFCDFFM